MNLTPDWLDVHFFSQLPKDEFLANFRSKRCCRVSLSADALATLPDWEDFNFFLSNHRLAHPRIRMAQQGVEESRLTILTPRQGRRGEPLFETQADRIMMNLREGATLVMDAVEQSIPKIRNLANSVEKHFCVRPQVNAYITFGDSRGFGLHWDDHDVFIIQVAGTKTWNMYGFTREAPLHTDFHETHAIPENVTESLVLKPGDIFYVPRGHWHDVLGNKEPTIHLTIGVNSATGIDLLNWMINKAREFVEFRRDLPLPSEKATREYAESFSAALLQLLDGDFIDAYRVSSKQGSTPHAYLSLPYGISSASTPPPESLLFLLPSSFHSELSTDAFIVQSNNRCWTLPPIASSLIALLQEGPKTVNETWITCGQGYNLDSWREFINELIHSGLIYAQSARNTATQ